MKFKDLTKKFTSRKFIACIAGVAGGVVLIISGNTLEGTAAIIASVVTYICAEAGIDKAAVKNTLESITDKLGDTESNTHGDTEGNTLEDTEGKMIGFKGE